MKLTLLFLVIGVLAGTVGGFIFGPGIANMLGLCEEFGCLAFLVFTPAIGAALGGVLAVLLFKGR